jgi:uncharacterized membrane protein YbhN (UPF0104 family)
MAEGKRTITPRQILQFLAALAVLAAVAFFFRHEFSENWEQIRSTKLAFDYSYLAASLLFVILSYLVNTHAWRYGINLAAHGRRLSYLESVGMVNTTQLTKYLPGKVWGYAMQMMLIDRESIGTPVVLYVNVFLALSNVFVYLVIAAVYFVFASSLLPGTLFIAAGAALAGAYAFFLLFNARFFSLGLRLVALVTKKSIRSYEMPLKGILVTQAIAFAGALLFALSAVLCVRGLGLEMSPLLAFGVAAGFLFADAIGFLFIVAPGGIGIREGLFFMVLREHGAESLALILPIAMRLVSMLADGILGAAGLYFLRKYLNKDKA